LFLDHIHEFRENHAFHSIVPHWFRSLRHQIDAGAITAAGACHDGLEQALIQVLTPCSLRFRLAHLRVLAIEDFCLTFRADAAYLLTASLRSFIGPMSCAASPGPILGHLHIAVTPDTVGHLTPPDNSNPILVSRPQMSRGSPPSGEKPFHHKNFGGFFLTTGQRGHDWSVYSLFADRCSADRPAEKASRGPHEAPCINTTLVAELAVTAPVLAVIARAACITKKWGHNANSKKFRGQRSELLRNALIAMAQEPPPTANVISGMHSR
jgi:hypothetical protein